MSATENNKRRKALIAMSGGVDSSVAAALMQEQGYDCIGATMKLYENADIVSAEDVTRKESRTCSVVEDASEKENKICSVVKDAAEREGKTCCTADDAEDAAMVARKLGMPFYVFRFTEEFRCQVMERFVNSYLKGETPNPCID